jgi:plastocyanin
MVRAARWSAVAVLLALSACSGGKEKDTSTDTGSGVASPAASPATTPLSNGETASFHGERDITNGPASVAVELDDFYFGPTILVGKPGASVKLELENEGTVEHNFSLTAQNVSTDVEPGQKAEVTVTFQTGTAPFFCKYHAPKGMRGELRASS